MGDEITVGEVSRRVDQHQKDIEKLRDGQVDAIARTVAPLIAPLAEGIGEIKRDLDKHLDWHDKQASERVGMSWQKASVYIAGAACLVGVITWAITLLATRGK